MNALWNFIASYFPSIRIYNDIQDNYISEGEESDDDDSYDLPTTMPLPSPSRSGQRHDRPTLRTTALDGSGAIDADHSRLKQLETFNGRLQEQVLSLQRQLEHIQADFSSTKMELEHQRSANTVLVSQKGQLSVELAQACAAHRAQATEVHNLRTSYAELANSVRTLESSGEELRSLKSFLTKTDDYSGQQIIQAVHDLNSEILQLAATVSDEFPLTRRSPGLWKESHCEFVREAIGDGMLALLRDGDHEDDPTIVQLAIQAWEVWCCHQVLDAFCAGAPPEVDRFLRDIFHEMQSSGENLFLVSYLLPLLLTLENLRTRTASDDVSLANPNTYVHPGCCVCVQRTCTSLPWLVDIIISYLTYLPSAVSHTRRFGQQHPGSTHFCSPNAALTDTVERFCELSRRPIFSYGGSN
jgi:hypothetical protein